MSREIDPRFPPQRRRVNVDYTRWVVIGYLPAQTQKEFWQKVKQSHPEIAQMRRDGANLIKNFNAVFQMPEDRYQQIMGEKNT